MIAGNLRGRLISSLNPSQGCIIHSGCSVLVRSHSQRKWWKVTWLMWLAHSEYLILWCCGICTMRWATIKNLRVVCLFAKRYSNGHDRPTLHNLWPLDGGVTTWTTKLSMTSYCMRVMLSLSMLIVICSAPWRPFWNLNVVIGIFRVQPPCHLYWVHGTSVKQHVFDSFADV